MLFRNPQLALFRKCLFSVIKLAAIFCKITSKAGLNHESAYIIISRITVHHIPLVFVFLDLLAAKDSCLQKCLQSH